ncbi:6-carboxytetrahydropterin synthase [Parendozoicomonas sp. Alg238-R29]|uniref:6-pyruvoyl trahydropterin synthase family protein n=1 Tax=Parendozoicomonas sp. Alg238-R29 TaxID=2993446 RepID=UPI00248E2269|nr:6-carboxytetrahydropterin synthase [Parendozoicomonas sp. Alg238-R29]
MSVLFVEQLTTIDFSYLCPERGLVGETWLVDVALTGELNDEGMVFDFGHVKKEIKSMIDSYADHALLVPARHEQISVVEHEGEREAHLNLIKGGQVFCKAPSQAILPLPVTEITPELIRPLLEQHVLAGLPDNVRGIEMQLYPESIEGPYFHYSHGLKKHKGDCQRIAHGHRSQIKIFVDDQRRSDLEQQIASDWSDIYLATREDLKDSKNIQGLTHLTFSYTAIQGRFELQVPERICYLVDTDTTIELIAAHLSEIVGLKSPGSQTKIIVNEGYCKGAISVFAA